jgi:hypothetical protein
VSQSFQPTSCTHSLSVPILAEVIAQDSPYSNFIWKFLTTPENRPQLRATAPADFIQHIDRLDATVASPLIPFFHTSNALSRTLPGSLCLCDGAGLLVVLPNAIIQLRAGVDLPRGACVCVCVCAYKHSRMCLCVKATYTHACAHTQSARVVGLSRTMREAGSTANHRRWV